MEDLNNTVITSFQNILKLKRDINTVSKRLGSYANMANLDRSFLTDQKNRIEHYLDQLDREYTTISGIFKQFKKYANPDVYEDYKREHQDCYNFSIIAHNIIDKIESLLSKENTRNFFGRRRCAKKRLVIDLKRLLKLH